MIDNIDALNDYVHIVNNQSKYWMVRAMGGEYYHDFIDDKFIAIGYNEILLNTIRQLDEDSNIARRQLREIVNNVYHDREYSRPGQIVSQLLRLLALGILFINGGGLKIDWGGFHLDLSTDGLFKKFDEHMDREVDRELRMSIKNSLDSLEIKTPEDYKKAVIELYRTQNENRVAY